MATLHASRAALLVAACAGLAQALPAQSLPLLHPMNPVAEARSGLYFQPLAAQSAGWRVSLGLDYASMVELDLRRSLADTSYLLDAEVLRVNVSASRNLGSRAFVTGEAYFWGSYGGFLDGFLNWYHGLFGISYPEREQREHNTFAYRYEFPSNRVVRFASHGAELGDIRLGLGLRHGRWGQSVLSLTLPTNTAGAGYGRGTVSLNVLNTFRAGLTPRLVYEGSINGGVTPRHGTLASVQRTTFLLLTSGMRWRTVGRLWSFGNLYLHSPYYVSTAEAAQLDGWDLTVDFGWIIRSRAGREFRFGMTEDLKPGGPAIDANFRLGYTW
jgi:Protein of unknown function (DUF3187)